MTARQSLPAARQTHDLAGGLAGASFLTLQGLTARPPTRQAPRRPIADYSGLIAATRRVAAQGPHAYQKRTPSDGRSAVRDLYGTMIAEGATKGILVTTSHYGRDSREFAKDKPITLIDGANLVHMFQKHGRDVQIVMLPKGDPRRGLGTAAG